MQRSGTLTILETMVGHMRNPMPAQPRRPTIAPFKKLGDSEPVAEIKQVKKTVEPEKKSDLVVRPKPVDQVMEPETEDEKQEKLKKRINEIRSEIHCVMMVKPIRNTELEDLWGRYYAKDTYSLPFEVNGEKTRKHLTPELKEKIDQHNLLVAMVKREAPKPRADDELSDAEDINRSFAKGIMQYLNMGHGW